MGEVTPWDESNYNKGTSAISLEQTIFLEDQSVSIMRSDLTVHDIVSSCNYSIGDKKYHSYCP